MVCHALAQKFIRVAYAETSCFVPYMISQKRRIINYLSAFLPCPNLEVAFNSEGVADIIDFIETCFYFVSIKAEKVVTESCGYSLVSSIVVDLFCQRFGKITS